MTSKEALKELKFQVGNITYFNHDLQSTTFKVRDSGLFEIIEKDLEVLEILKPFVKLETLNPYCSIYKDESIKEPHYFVNGLETDKETYEKVKEWLEK